MKNERFNSSGCKDMTAYEAINKVSKAERNKDKQVGELIKVVKFIIDNCGFELVNRIAILDKETGREYR